MVSPGREFSSGSFFASVGHMGMGVGVSPNTPNSADGNLKMSQTNLFGKHILPEAGLRMGGVPELLSNEEWEIGEEEELKKKKKNKKGGLKLRVKISNPSLRRLISGAIAGAVSRTAVAPLETIRTHLMVGSCGHSTMEVFQDIMKNEGWKGLFRGNLVNVIRVAPSKAVELFAYDTVKKQLTPKPGEQPIIPIPASPIAGAVAGISSTLLTYPLELLKTRLTVQRGVYKGLFDAFLKIVREEGPAELYRGLTPSLQTLFKEEEIGNIATLLIGSAAGAISSSATFPLEVARKHMQAGALNGRQYRNMLHALGLGPSCMKLVPAAGISFMCYEACKKILVENEEKP
ncbi:hypothetical protein M9H77_24562 [Catharanthus roseus]|uniref:Uncharacterized protein n=1 Tax=Catharanthus roseus TaxID=4058 RepID=A0ACC0AXH6_CATRO|nr:hypothetical protein M9H77_24562 [Catharanthus roseus]